ncbi:MAG: D-hexose-6-phosphate mutarotase, partial [Verrucomicrobiaceae bacterium]|nr:D-hexose-6-phosphate mutarotase [Verrucomicrobiaceae bacterium]
MSLPSTDIHGHSHQPKVILATPEGATAEIHLHGAHVTSWKPAGKAEQLFLSTKSAFGPGAAIRGGVPVIFPQFSTLGPLPRHGFVRTTAWEILHQTSDEATLVFRDSAATWEIWPHAFRLEFSARLERDRLEMRLRVVNTGTSPFLFASALHTYLRVQDIAQTTVEGLHGFTYRDANTMVEHVEARPRIEFNEEVDRLYYET